MQKTNLTQSQTEEVMETLLADANPAVIGAFLALLRAKGETLEEVRTPCNFFAEQRLIYTAYYSWEEGMACLYFEIGLYVKVCVCPQISNHFGSWADYWACKRDAKEGSASANSGRVFRYCGHWG